MATLSIKAETKDFTVSEKNSYRTNLEVYTRLKLTDNIHVSMVVTWRDKNGLCVVPSKGERHIFFQVFCEIDGISGDLEYCYTWKEVLKQMAIGYDIN